MPRLSLRQYLLGFFLLLGTALLLICFGLYRVGQQSLREALEAGLSAELQWAAGILENRPGLLAHPHAADSLCKSLSAISGNRLSLVDGEGRLVADSHLPAAGVASAGNHLDRPELVEAHGRGWGRARRLSLTLDKDLLFLARRLPAGGFVRLASELKPLKAYNRGGTAVLVIFSLSMLAFSVAASGWIGRKIADSCRGMAPPGARERREGSEPFSETAFLGEAWSGYARELDRARRELADERDKLLLILNEMRGGIIILDAEGLVKVANPASRRLLGHDPDHPLENRRLHAQVQVKPLLDAVTETLEGGKPSTVTLDRGPFSPHDISCHIQPLGGEESREYLLTLDDVGEFRNVDRMKTEFVANASHELKTPLSSIKGYAETLLDGALDNAAVRASFIGKIHQNALRLERLVANLLHLSQLEYRHAPGDTEVLNLKECADACIAMHRHAQERLEVAVENRLPSNLRLRMERRDLELILNNLVGNAIKYNVPRGKVTLRLEREGGRILVVEDTGRGIPARILPRIFERFYRADDARGQMEGTGLGLAIVKHAANRYGMSVHAESEEGQGSRFLVAVPSGLVATGHSRAA